MKDNYGIWIYQKRKKKKKKTMEYGYILPP